MNDPYVIEFILVRRSIDMADRYFEVNKINVRYGDIQVLWGY